MKKLNTIMIFMVIALISCFMPITEEVVFAVEDNRNPIIVISSPEEESVYMSMITIEGYVRDDSRESGDNKGSLSSLSISASSSINHRGRIEINSDGSYESDADFGRISGSNFIYNSKNKSFTIKIDTTEMYQPQIMDTTITAVDRNGNETKEILQLRRSGGPHIDLASPEDTFRPTEPIIISGTVANSEVQQDKYNELTSITLRIPALSGLDVTLDIANRDVQTKLIEEKIPGRGKSLKYNVENRELTATIPMFSTESTSLKSLEVIISATDKNGNTARVSRTLYTSNYHPTVEEEDNLVTDRDYYFSNLPLLQGGPSSSDVFYGVPTSKFPTVFRSPSLKFSGKTVLHGGSTELTLKLKFVNEKGIKTVTPEATVDPKDSSIYAYSYTAEIGLFKLEDGSSAGNTTITLTATDNNPEEARTTERQWFIQDDSEAPEFSEFSSSTTGNTVTLRFKIHDTGTGVNFDTLEVVALRDNNTVDSATNITVAKNKATGVCSASIPLGTDTQKRIKLSVKDKIGNTGSTETPVLETISLTSSRTPNTAAWPGDIITLSVTASDSQAMNTQRFNVTIAGQRATVVSRNPNTLTAELAASSIPPSYTNGSSIPFEITRFESTEGIPGVNGSISSTTNNTSVRFYKEGQGPELEFGSVTATNGNVDNNTVYLRDGGTFSLTVTSNQPLSSTDPSITIEPSVPSVSTTFAQDRLSFTVTSGAFSGPIDADITVTISGVNNAASEGSAASLTRSLGKYYYGPPPPTNNISVTLKDDDGNKKRTAREVGDRIVLRFTTSDRDPQTSSPTVSLTLDNTPLSNVARRNGSVQAPSYEYAYTLTANDISGAAAEVGYSIDFTDKAGNSATTASGTSTIYEEGPTLTLGSVTATNGNVDNNTVYLRNRGTFSLTVNSNQPLSPTDPSITIEPSVSTTTVFAEDRLSFTVTSGAFSGTIDADIVVTISGVNNDAGIGNPALLTVPLLGKYYYGRPTLTISVTLEDGNGAPKQAARGVGDRIVLRFTTSDRDPQTSSPTVSLTLDNTPLSNVARDTSVQAPSYKYEYTITANDISGAAAEVGYSIDFTDKAGNSATTASGTSTIYEEGPTLTLGSVSARTNGNVDNNTVYLRNRGTFSLTVNSNQPLSPTDPSITIEPSVSTTTVFNQDRSSFTVTSGQFSGTSDADITVTISGVNNVADVGDPASLTVPLGKYYYGRPRLTSAIISVTLENDDGDEKQTAREVGDRIVLRFTTSDRVPQASSPTVSLTLDDTPLSNVDRDDDSVQAPSYEYTYTITAEDTDDVDNAAAEVGYSIDFTDMAGNSAATASGTSTIP